MEGGSTGSGSREICHRCSVAGFTRRLKNRWSVKACLRCVAVSEASAEYLKVEGLRPGLRDVNLLVRVVDVGPPRTVSSQRDRSEHRVAEALVGDETGSVLLTLWDDLIEGFKPDDVLDIRNGYTSLFRGSMRMNIGRHGSADRVDREVGEVNTENNISQKMYEETPWREPAGSPFRRRRRR